MPLARITNMMTGASVLVGYIHPEIVGEGVKVKEISGVHEPPGSSWLPTRGTSAALSDAISSLTSMYLGHYGVTSVSEEPGGGERILVFSTTPDEARMMVPGNWAGFFTDIRHSTGQVSFATGVADIAALAGVPVGVALGLSALGAPLWGAILGGLLLGVPLGVLADVMIVRRGRY